ncbi:hypothetical protein GQ43DRAFT_54535 [Delitschia confertaspora ATCC 74209]|uniref:Uncharacterized protein n=1 Tax=Delitschia confertaspora ATCC 74209 TaxID=1513339 RepID=A0A9P4MV94_9PLEO|nr:hypothetical protein GQ43DRAFT_54535 [Delitschia confertaspora ATCC 74209]
MARYREPEPEYYYHSHEEREPPLRSHRRRHRAREQEHDDYIEISTPKPSTNHRRRTTEDRRRPELDVHELRDRRAEYYTQPESDRRGEPERMAQEIPLHRTKTSSRSTHRESRGQDGTKRQSRRQTVVEDDRSEDYVYGRPESRRVVADVTIKRSSGRRGSDEGPSRRTEDSPRSGSRKSSSVRKDVPKLSRFVLYAHRAMALI